jgi:hypothetical protein
MNDEEYFTHYQDCFATIYQAGAPNETDLVYLTDEQFRYRRMTKGMLTLFGVESITEIYNKTCNEVALNLQVTATGETKQFDRQHSLIKKNHKKGVYLEILPYQGTKRIFTAYKTPIINPQTNNFVGLQGYLTDLLWPNVLKTLFKMHGTKGLLLGHKNGFQNPIKEYPLTNIQHMVLYLCLNNYSYSEIALLMNEFGHSITPIRVNDYLEQLKLIFHVRNKTQLIEKALGLSFHVLLPIGLFNKLSSIEISNEAAAIICCNCELGTCEEHSPP